jgi:hypothetical protein
VCKITADRKYRIVSYRCHAWCRFLSVGQVHEYCHILLGQPEIKTMSADRQVCFRSRDSPSPIIDDGFADIRRASPDFR